ncbi:hypothetical protein [Bhargavaea massiliensis]|nr:hypothetical protein [Bhargavaea massiliensis]
MTKLRGRMRKLEARMTKLTSEYGTEDKSVHGPSVILWIRSKTL